MMRTLLGISLRSTEMIRLADTTTKMTEMPHDHRRSHLRGHRQRGADAQHLRGDRVVRPISGSRSALRFLGENSGSRATALNVLCATVAASAIGLACHHPTPRSFHAKPAEVGFVQGDFRSKQHIGHPAAGHGGAADAVDVGTGSLIGRNAVLHQALDDLGRAQARRSGRRSSCRRSCSWNHACSISAPRPGVSLVLVEGHAAHGLQVGFQRQVAVERRPQPLAEHRDRVDARLAAGRSTTNTG